MTKQFEQFVDDVCVLVFAKNRDLSGNEQQAVYQSKRRLERHGADVVFSRVAMAKYNKSKQETAALKDVCEALGVKVEE
jgi:hypothetical protein